MKPELSLDTIKISKLRVLCYGCIVKRQGSFDKTIMQGKKEEAEKEKDLTWNRWT